MDGRWPRRVYGVGEEPDARFTLANERTFLAWIRTSLALMASGVALDAVGVPDDDRLRTSLALLLVVLGTTCAIAAFARWMRAEQALRSARPLPGLSLGLLLVGGLTVVGVVVLLAVLAG